MPEPLLYVEVLTPERSLFAGEARALFFPAPDGILGILPRHAPLLTKLGSGMITCVKANGEEVCFFCAGGFAEVIFEGVVVLADLGERDDQIDADRAALARQRAEKRLFSGSPEVDYERAAAALHRAIERLRATRPKVR